MRALVLGIQFPGIGLGASVSNQRKATKLCKDGEFVFLPIQSFGQCACSHPEHLCWMIMQREKKDNFSFFATVRLTPYLLHCYLHCVGIAKLKKVYKLSSLICKIISLEMQRIQALAVLLINTCFKSLKHLFCEKRLITVDYQF